MTRRRWPWLLLGGALLTVAAAALVLPRLLDVERHRARIEQALSAATGWEAELGAVRLSVLKGLVLVVSPARLAAPGAPSSQLEIESLEIRAALWPLLRGVVEIRSIDAVRPTITLVRRTPAEGWILPPIPLGGSAALPRAAAGRPSGVSLVIARVGLRDGRIRFEDRAAQPARVTELSRVDLAIAPASGTLEGSAALANDGGRLSFKGSLAQGLDLRLDGVRTELLQPFLGAEFIHGGGMLAGDVRVTQPLAIEGRLIGTSVTLLAGSKPFERPIEASFAIKSEGERFHLERLAANMGGLALTGSGPLAPALALRVVLAPAPLDVVLAASESVLPLPLALEPPGTVAARLEIEQPAAGPLVYAASGTLSAARFVASDALPPIDNLRASFELSRRGVLAVRIEEGRAAGGPVTGIARLSSIDPPGTLTFEGGLENAVLGSLLQGFAGDEARRIVGSTGVRAAVGLDLARPVVDARALSGRVSLGSRAVGLPGWDLENAIGRAIEQKLAGIGSIAALFGRDLPGSGATEGAADAVRELLESLEAEVDFDRFPWRLERLALAAGDLDAAGGGTFDPIASVVDLRLVARFSPEKTRRLVAQASRLRTLVDREGRLSLPVELRGALTSPSIKVDLRQALGSLKEETKQEAVKSLLEGLLDRKKKR